jgi:hypothetical protein
MVRCECTTAKGTRCSKSAQEGSNFCAIHSNCVAKLSPKHTIESTIKSESPKNRTEAHPQSIIEVKKEVHISVDSGIANLIRALWRQGYRTTNSCQDNYILTRDGTRRHFVWIAFKSPQHASRFIINYIGDNHDRYNSVIEDWEININIQNSNVTFEEDEDGVSQIEDLIPFKIMFYTNVRFPIEQLPDIEDIFIV